MTADSPDPTTLRLAEQRRIDQVCGRFEAACSK
jgi:hypothetical protein